MAQADMSQEAMRDRFLPTAQAAWPASPCAGREVVHLDADARVDVFDQQDHYASGGRGDAATCQIWMRHIDYPVWFCEGLVHEAGHLAGYSHTGEPGPQAPAGPLAAIMDVRQGSLLPFEPCVEALMVRFPALTPRQQAFELIYPNLPGVELGRWHLACRFGRCIAVPRYRAMTRRYRYWLAAPGFVDVSGPAYVVRRVSRLGQRRAGS